MPAISLLPDLVISQIAAGEVLENPASAVKELIENSLDAGASDIRVELEGGGLHKLVVEDDGCGMDAADALRCLERHATSKLHSLSDLERLLTMGFRGEALAAIAAVSRLELTTSNGVESTHVASEGGAPAHKKPCARNRGTTITVRELFFNTPARLKFQKSPSTSAAKVLDVVQTIALAHPEVRFTLHSNGKMTFTARPADWRARIEEILGPFAHAIETPTLRGLLGSPAEARATRSGQTLFVNGRPIFSPLIAKAVKEGFGTRIEERLFPTFVLFLDVPPDTVDVNVHPQKREVRFRDESRLFAVVRSAIASSFEVSAPALEPLPWSFSPAHPSAPTFVLNDAPWEQPSLTLAPTPSRPVALLGNFLLIDGDGWSLLDVRGASARIAFEALQVPSNASQPLLIPFEWPTDAPESLAERLQAMHLEARAVGKKTVAIDAVPPGLELGDLEPLVRELQAGRELAAAVTRATRARRSSMRFDEACAVWRELARCNDQSYDPLGKKLLVPVTNEILQELFR